MIIVTGANRGLGFQLCCNLLQKGKEVLLTAREPKNLQIAVQQLHKKGFTRFNSCVLDVTSLQQKEKFVEYIRNTKKHIQCLVNNAAVFPNEWSEDVFQVTKRINYQAPVWLIENLVDYFQENSRIINVSSGYGKLNEQSSYYRNAIETAESLKDLEAIKFNNKDNEINNISVPCYKITKAMLNKATKILAQDKRLLSKNINCVSCSPGWARTRMGGDFATRSIPQGAASIEVLITQKNPFPTGNFFLDGQLLEW